MRRGLQPQVQEPHAQNFIIFTSLGKVLFYSVREGT
ncbi:hypothetical protein OROHE_009090 [Orobanche hederae]